MTIQIDVFIIGRMSLPKEPDPQGAELSPNTILVADAANEATRRIDDERKTNGAATRVQVEWRVHVPDMLSGTDIVGDVFGKIDTAEIVIADLSGNDSTAGAPSPNVMYELAFVHCLGIPWIGLTLKQHKIPFYLRHNRIVELKAFSREEVINAIKPRMEFILQFFLPERERTGAPIAEDPARNPIANFYGGVSLIDVSAAAGLAHGYFENYVLPVYNARNEDDHPRHLIVAVPSSLEQPQGHDEDNIRELLRRQSGVSFSENKFLPASKRTCLFLIDGKIAIDVPRTAYTLNNSNRLRRISKDSAFRHLRHKVSSGLLASFRRVLQYEVERGKVAPSRIHIVGLSGGDDNLELLETLDRIAGGSASG